MADNVQVGNVSPLASFTVATDDVGTGQAQIIKLAISSDGSATLIPATATFGLGVDVNRLPNSSAGAHTAVSVGTSATLLIAAASTRKAVYLRPAGQIWLGYSNTVTTTTGLPIYANEIWEETIFKGALYAIATGTIDVRVLEAQ